MYFQVGREATNQRSVLVMLKKGVVHDRNVEAHAVLHMKLLS